MGFVPTHTSSCSTLTFPAKCKKCTAPTFFFGQLKAGGASPPLRPILSAVALAATVLFWL